MQLMTPATVTAIVLSAAVSTTAAAGTPQSEAQPRSPSSVYSLRASDVIGAVVVNGNNEELGKVDDLVIVRDSGDLHAIIASGGILGIGDALYAVPLQELKTGSSGERVFLDISKERFLERAEFEYLQGESHGRRIWEKRLVLQDKLAEEREEVKDERRDAQRHMQRIRELEQEIEALRKQQ